MSDREDKDFGFDSEEPFPDEGEEFTLGVADEGEDDNLEMGDAPEEDLFTVADDEEPLIEEELTPDFSEQAFDLEESQELNLEEDPAFELEESLEPDEEDSPFVFPEGGDQDVPFVADTEEERPPKPQGSPARLLMAVLLVLLAGALAFYFLGMSDSGDQPTPPTTRVASAKKPITLPKKPLASTLPASSADPMPAEEKGLAKKASQQPPAAKAAPQPAKPVAVAKKPDLPIKTEQDLPAAKDPSAGTTIVAKAVVAEKKKELLPATKAKEAPEVKKAHKTSAKYQIQVGAFILKSNLKTAEKTVRRLGFTPLVKESTTKTAMVRLKYGQFNAEEGRLKLAELKKIDRDAFILHEGKQLGVYVGSYKDLDKARHYSDQLWEKGIHVDEVPVEVDVPLYRLIIGGFPDRESAGVAVKKVEKSGLDAQVLASRKS